MIVEHYKFPSAKDDTFSTFLPEEYEKQWPQYVLKLKNVLLGPYGTIYDENYNLIPEANYNYSFWSEDMPSPESPLDAQNKKYLNPPELPHKVEPLEDGVNYVYGCHYFNIYVYGHLHDTLQDLGKIEGLNLSSPILLTSPLTEHVNNVAEHFSFFGYDLNSIKSISLPKTPSCLYRVPTLYYPSPTAYPSNVSRGGLDFLRLKYPETPKSSKEKELKLYLRRASHHRSVKNEEEVVKFLREHSFTIVTGNETLEEHITLFSSAKIIVGAHGALFKNLIFSTQKPKVVEFQAKSLNNPCYSQGLAPAAGLSDYHYVLMDDIGGSKTGYHINIDIDILKTFLQ